MTATVAAPSPAKVDRRREHLFFIGMALAMTLVVFIGFARSFFMSFLWTEHDPHASSEPVYYIHGAFAAAWMAISVIQPLLIARRRVKWHRQVGWLGAAVAGLVVLASIVVLLASAARPADSALPPTPLDVLGVLLSGIGMFGVLVGLAIAFRRDGPSHKRLMFLATINLLQAAIVRIPLAFLYDAGPLTTFLLAYTFIVPLVVWDIGVLRRMHPATRWGGLGLIASLPVRLWLSRTAVWLTAAKWAVDLVAK
jgi:FtsH-binding integral membrane protein